MWWPARTQSHTHTHTHTRTLIHTHSHGIWFFFVLFLWMYLTDLSLISTCVNINTGESESLRQWSFFSGTTFFFFMFHSFCNLKSSTERDPGSGKPHVWLHPPPPLCCKSLREQERFSSVVDKPDFMKHNSFSTFAREGEWVCVGERSSVFPSLGREVMSLKTRSALLSACSSL